MWETFSVPDEARRRRLLGKHRPNRWHFACVHGGLAAPGHFIANEFTAEANSETRDIINPAHESVLTFVIVGTADDVDRAVAAAIAAKTGWARLVPKQRAEILHQIADRVAQHAEVLARLESANTVSR